MKKSILLLAFLLVTGFCSYAQADSITWLGNSETFDIDTLDWSTSSALIAGAFPMETSPGTTPLTIYAQASLGNFIYNSQILTNNGLNTNYEVTYVGGFGETGSLVPGFDITNLEFDSTNDVNFFEVYYDDFTSGVKADAVNGTGYSDGTLILSGVIVQSEGTFKVTNNGAIEQLDQYGINNWGNVGTLSGTGSNAVTVDVDFYNPNYFSTASLDLFLVELLFGTEQAIPYEQAEPSKHYWDATLNGGAGGYVTPTLGGENYNDGTKTWDYVNGLASTQGNNPTDLLNQLDSNSSFTVVPEPGTMLLFGVGLLCAGAVSRKRSIK